MNEIKQRHRKLIGEMFLDLNKETIKYILFIEENKITKMMRKISNNYGKNLKIKYENLGGNTGNLLFDNQLLVFKNRKFINGVIIQEVEILPEQAKHFVRIP